MYECREGGATWARSMSGWWRCTRNRSQEADASSCEERQSAWCSSEQTWVREGSYLAPQLAVLSALCITEITWNRALHRRHSFGFGTPGEFDRRRWRVDRFLSVAVASIKCRRRQCSVCAWRRAVPWNARSVAETAAESKTAKYANIFFHPIAVESLRLMHESAWQFLVDLSCRITSRSSNNCEGNFLFQCISVLLHHFNSVLLHDSFVSVHCLQ